MPPNLAARIREQRFQHRCQVAGVGLSVGFEVSGESRIQILNLTPVTRHPTPTFWGPCVFEVKQTSVPSHYRWPCHSYRRLAAVIHDGQLPNPPANTG